jgi:hypothetical protein
MIFSILAPLWFIGISVTWPLTLQSLDEFFFSLNVRSVSSFIV